MYPFSVNNKVILLASTKKKILPSTRRSETVLNWLMVEEYFFPSWWNCALFPKPLKEHEAFLVYLVGYTTWADIVLAFFATSCTCFQDRLLMLSCFPGAFILSMFWLTSRALFLKVLLWVSRRNPSTSSLGLVSLLDFSSPSSVLVNLKATLVN